MAAGAPCADLLHPDRIEVSHTMAREKTFSIALLASIAMMLEALGPANTLDKTPRASLLVTPLSGMAFSGPQGGPFSPPFFQYRLSASTGTVSYSIVVPSWLSASSSFGQVGTSGITITLTVSATALRLPPGRYGPSVAFTNVSNGRGSATRSATLGIEAPRPPPSPAARHVPDHARGFLMENGPGHLLDDRGGKLLAK